MTRILLTVMIVSLAGCASWSPLSRPSTPMLDKADKLVLKGQYADALEAYEQILAKSPDADVALRARASREAVADLLTARAQLGRLTVVMKAQESDLVRLRDELARARAELTRLTAETDRLRAELDQLKRIDIDLERRQK